MRKMQKQINTITVVRIVLVDTKQLSNINVLGFGHFTVFCIAVFIEVYIVFQISKFVHVRNVRFFLNFMVTD